LGWKAVYEWQYRPTMFSKKVVKWRY